jgi:hypothetical protein
MTINSQFCTKRVISQVTGLSDSTLKQYRLSGIWIEGIHWQRLNSRCVLYNLPMILDWVAHRYYPEAHQRTIDDYLRSLSSNQRKQKRGR